MIVTLKYNFSQDLVNFLKLFNNSHIKHFNEVEAEQYCYLIDSYCEFTDIHLFDTSWNEVNILGSMQSIYTVELTVLGEVVRQRLVDMGKIKD
jgi:hypothetical protein